MRVALLEIDLDRDSRSGNLQRILEAIHQAVRHRPAPDLLVLPAACDTGGGIAPRSRAARELAMVADALSWEARDWGLYIVCGLHARGDDGWRPCTVLFDADGDAVASTAEPAGASGEVKSQGVAIWQCPHGRIILADSVAAIRLLPPNVVEGAFVAVPLSFTPAGRAKAEKRKTVEALVHSAADRSEAYWGMVAAAGVDGPGATCVLGPAGSPVGEVEGGGGKAIFIADVPIEPPPQATAKGSSGRTDQAD